MNRWSVISQNINLYLWQKSNEFYTEKLSRYWTSQRQTNQMTQNQGCWALEQHLLACHSPFFLWHNCPTLFFHCSHEKKNSKGLPIPQKEWRKNQTWNSKADFTINFKCGLLSIMKYNIYKQCSSAREQQTHQTLSERDFKMDYVHWLPRITLSEKAHICDLRLKRYCYICQWKLSRNSLPSTWNLPKH